RYRGIKLPSCSPVNQRNYQVVNIIHVVVTGSSGIVSYASAIVVVQRQDRIVGDDLRGIEVADGSLPNLFGVNQLHYGRALRGRPAVVVVGTSRSSDLGQGANTRPHLHIALRSVCIEVGGFGVKIAEKSFHAIIA